MSLARVDHARDGTCPECGFPSPVDTTELRRRSDLLDEALDALGFYVGICGNTAAMVPISSAREAYKRANAILTKAGRTPEGREP
jgi:hypothetical protein